MVQLPQGQGFGKFYPDQGIIVLNPNAFINSIGSSIDKDSARGTQIEYGDEFKKKKLTSDHLTPKLKVVEISNQEEQKMFLHHTTL